MASIYEQIGGEKAVDLAVEEFYRRVLTDERIARFFDDIDMDKQMAKQKAFLTMVMGGSNQYTGLDMRKGHAHLLAQGLNDSHVDAVVENLGETLKSLNVPIELVNQVTALASSLRNDILSR